MDNRRGDEPGRRAEDARWLRIQKDVMSLVTSTRQSQLELAKLEIEVGKLADHVEEVDDHLRGVSGHDSMDTRVTVLEHEYQMHGRLLQQISDQFTKLHELTETLKGDISTIKIKRAVTEEVETTAFGRFREWMRFWGPIALLTLGGLGETAKYIAGHWPKIRSIFHSAPASAQQLRDEAAKERNGPRGKTVQKKLDSIEKERKAYE